MYKRMAHRLGSNINSPLFMSDPVPIRNSKNSTIDKVTDDSYLLKGDNKKDNHKSSYEYLGGEEEIFIIRYPGGAYQLHRKNLRDTLKELKPQSNVQVRQLSEEQTESFRSIIEALNLLHGSKELYNIMLEDVKNVFSDVNNVKPGTVAAFFIGCSDNTNFDGAIGCNPKCAGSLAPSEDNHDYTACEDLVLVYNEGLFSSLNDKSSTHVYIYIEQDSFSGFTEENINQLKEAGVESATLVFGNKDNSYTEVTKRLLIEELPNKNNQPKLSPEETINNTLTNNVNGGAVFIVIIIIIILLLILILFRRNY